MERKVIKFNLVGAIFVLLLIVAIITGIIVVIIKNNKSADKENKTQDVYIIHAQYNYNNV